MVDFGSLGMEVVRIGREMLASFMGIWPYLLITIPIAVAVQMSGAARHINRVVGARPFVAILGATLVGAFSPLCACGVVPMIASLMIGGVPLAPIMAFWIASPTMDLEIFFLSVGLIGWELAVWRLVATLVLSLGAGLLAHWLMQQGWLGERALRADYSTSAFDGRQWFERGWVRLATAGRRMMGVAMPGSAGALRLVPASESSCCGTSGGETGQSCETQTTCAAPTGGDSPQRGSSLFGVRLAETTAGATWMVIKFMAFAFLLQAFITLYVPDVWIVSVLGQDNPWSIVTAAALGMPVYTSNLAMLPMLSGLLEQGMNPAAALAFLISGPMLTLPSMAAVWGLATRRVFAIYIGVAFLGALGAGYVFGLSI